MAEVLLTTSEAAALLGCTPRNVRYKAVPELEPVRMGARLYFRETQVAALLAKRKTPATQPGDGPAD
jgi:hypothetical protein